jgi:hypothetical protein
MKRSAKGIYLLPEPMRQQLLPGPNLSLKSLTDFLLPSQHFNLARELSDPCKFFSKEPPTIVSENLTMRLQRLPTPDPDTVQKLIHFGHQAWLEGFRSVRYAHLQPEDDSGTDICLPLWIITFWKEVLVIKAVAGQWIQCRDWIKVQLKQKKSSERRQLAEQASILLTILPWGQNKPNGSGPIHALWRFLGPYWLSDSEQNEMLELIQDRCLDSPESCSQFRVENSYFAVKLLEAYDAGSDAYLGIPSFGWLRHLGEDLAKDRSTVVTVVHLGPLSETPHWVPLTIQRTRICFGDSFGTGMPARLQAACLWWLRQHHVPAPENIPPLCTLPITPQLDGHSCGILADNALDHFINARNNPLLGSSNSDVIIQRLKRFNLIAQNIIARVSIFIEFPS